MGDDAWVSTEPGNGAVASCDGAAHDDARLAAILRHSTEWIGVLDANAQLTFSSDGLGYGHQDVLGTDVFDLVHEDDRGRVVEGLAELLEGGDVVGPLECRVLAADGTWRELEVMGSSVADDPAIDGIIVINSRDVTERNERDARLLRERTYDRLTGLPRRASAVEHLERLLRRQVGAAVAMVDVDRLRAINEQLGRDGGDEVLRRIADRLVALPSTVATARLAGGTFLVTRAEVEDLDGFEAQLSAVFSRPLTVDGVLVHPSVSGGLTTALSGDAESVLAEAEQALRVAKQVGGGRFTVYGEVLRAEARREAVEESDLRVALVRRQLHLHYQPKIALDTGRIDGVEALLRWTHPERGPISPEEIVGLAERSGLIEPLGTWILHAACAQAAEWRARFGEDAPTVAINVAAGQFHRGLRDIVEDVIAETGVDPEMITLELTETTVMDDLEETASVLRALKDMGLSVSIDDFGTGYSSLAYLRRFPIDELKVDRSFVDGLGTNAEDTAIVASVIAMSGALGLLVVAEGVEDEVQLTELCRMGCEHGQGYLFSRAVSAADLDKLLTTQLARPDDLPWGLPTVAAGGTVIVADDAPEVLQLASLSLAAAGLTVRTVEDGESALALAEAEHPMAMILDIGLPGLSGFDVCAALRADPANSDITIIMLTARGAAADKVTAFQAGADDYIVKPFTPRDLVSRVRQAQRRRTLGPM
jgi:PAS domain S-box-containing protein/diguanylate cyclase (GGDEF)-like protein